MATIQEVFKQALEKPISDMPKINLVCKDVEPVVKSRCMKFKLGVTENSTIVLVGSGEDANEIFYMSQVGLMSNQWELELTEPSPTAKISTGTKAKKSTSFDEDDED